MRASLDPVLLAVQKLEETLGPNSRETDRAWCERLGFALAGVERALRERWGVVAEPEGLLSHVEEVAQEKMPVLDRRVDSLQQQLVDLLTLVWSLQAEVQEAWRAFASPANGTAPVPELTALREQGEQLVAVARQNMAEEIKLVQETVNTDIGVGD